MIQISSSPLVQPIPISIVTNLKYGEKSPQVRRLNVQMREFLPIHGMISDRFGLLIMSLFARHFSIA
jgi:hypothetical protein